jgi:hypothetical protein
VADRNGFRRRVDPYRVKVNFSYTTAELAARLGVHKNTVRHWQAKGLAPIDHRRPALFHGAAIRNFLISQRRERKRPCPPGTFYCFRCREPRAPALGMVDFIELRPSTGNLRALCGICGIIMHRRDALSAVMPGIDVQFVEAPQRLVGNSRPSPNCDLERQGAT